MNRATREILNEYEALFEKRKKEILECSDEISVTGDSYYVSNNGSDDNDGRSADRPWKTLEKVTRADLKPGDGVFFKRGDLFRGKVFAASGVTYAAYGTGDKPKFYGSEMSLADPELWEEYDKEHHIWKCRTKLLDSGTLVFNDGEKHARKLIPSYENLQFVCREDTSKPFVLEDEMTNDLDMFWRFDEILTRKPTRGKDFPIPYVENTYGDIFLRCDAGNPGEVFDEIESLARVNMFSSYGNKDVKFDNLCIKYVGAHGIGAGGGHVDGLTVTNCEFGWIGGSIQHYDGTDPNFMEGDRGSVTRYGNAVEICGGCNNYTVSNNYIYEIFDAGITHQVGSSDKITMTNILYSDNMVERCVYGIEYFLDLRGGQKESYMKNYKIKGNFIRLTGYGWGQQRHNVDTPAHIKSWNYANPAYDYEISNNIFDRSAYKMLHLVSCKDEFCPEMRDNTYIQHLGGTLGAYGGTENGVPDPIVFDNDVQSKINDIFGDKTAKVYYIDSDEN